MSHRRKRTPIKAIRLTCYSCSAGAWEEVRNCTVTDCPLFEYRMGKRPTTGTAKLTPIKAIRAYYLYLQCGSKKLVREQPLGLPCDPWRFGKRPAVQETYYDKAEQLIWFPWKREEQERAAQSSDQNTPENEQTPELAPGSEPHSRRTTHPKASRRSPSKRVASRQGSRESRKSDPRNPQGDVGE